MREVYGFVTVPAANTPGRDDLITKNKLLAARLLVALAFARPVSSNVFSHHILSPHHDATPQLSELEKPSNQRRGLYECIAILQFLCETIFRKKGPGLALRFPSIFGVRLPIPTLAWVMTMVSGVVINLRFII